MKLYKLKEKVKKYLNADYEYYDSVLGNQEWYQLEWVHEALEEVPQRIEISRLDYCMKGCGVTYALQRKDNKQFTEQERKDIEYFLNEFGSMENLELLIQKYINDDNYKIYSLLEWLKENHEKN